MERCKDDYKQARFKARIGSQGHSREQFGSEGNVACIGDRYIVSDSENHVLKEYTCEARLELTCVHGVVGDKGTKEHQLDHPADLCVGPGPTIYLSDSANHRIKVLNETIQIITVFGARGSAEDDFNTPKGLTYMRYCKEDEGFEYWADNSIDYKYLETVARKYVTIFSCRDIYIDRFTLLKEKIVGIKQKIEENKEKQEENKSENEAKDEEDVFASLKSYNQSSKNISSTKTELTRNDVVCDEANKYLNRGKIAEANFGEEKKIVDTATSSMSFSSWKLWKSQDKKD